MHIIATYFCYFESFKKLLFFESVPEGPELRLAAEFITRVCKSVIFCLPIIKSEVSKKNPDIVLSSAFERFRLSSVSRGKELLLRVAPTLSRKSKEQDEAKIIFRFGMSGHFFFGAPTELPSHSHLMFYSEDKSRVLAFVDPRRFGRWEFSDFDYAGRGSDPTREYSAFRAHILRHLHLAVFDRPICEVLLEQRFFNGVGNYLRAETLHRAHVRPFDRARDVLRRCFTAQELQQQQAANEHSASSASTNAVVGKKSVNTSKSKARGKKTVSQSNDLPASDAGPCSVLELCRDLSNQVVAMGLDYFAPDLDGDLDQFKNWLQCYQKAPNNLVDSKDRTVWFFGEPGELVPKVKKSRKATIKQDEDLIKQDEDLLHVGSSSSTSSSTSTSTSKSKSARARQPKTTKSSSNHESDSSSALSSAASLTDPSPSSAISSTPTSAISAVSYVLLSSKRKSSSKKPSSSSCTPSSTSSSSSASHDEQVPSASAKHGTKRKQPSKSADDELQPLHADVVSSSQTVSKRPKRSTRK